MQLPLDHWYAGRCRQTVEMKRKDGGEAVRLNLILTSLGFPVFKGHVNAWRFISQPRTTKIVMTDS